MYSIILSLSIFDPLVVDLPRFPNRDHAWDQRHRHVELVRYLNELRPLDPYRIDPALRLARDRLQLWRWLEEAHCANSVNQAIPRDYLLHLKRALPWDDYRCGRMPPDLPDVAWPRLVPEPEPVSVGHANAAGR